MTPIPRDLESRIELVESTLTALPGPDRLLLRLHYFDEVSCGTLASIFGTTPRAIHVRLHRARERFRALIHEPPAREIHRVVTQFTASSALS